MNSEKETALEQLRELAPSKLKRYEQSYRKQWEEIPAFKDWLTAVPINKRSAFCKYCRVILKAHCSDLRKHVMSKKHTCRTLEIIQSKLPVTQFDPAKDGYVEADDDDENDTASNYKALASSFKQSGTARQSSGFRDKNAEAVSALIHGLTAMHQRKVPRPKGSSRGSGRRSVKKSKPYMTPTLKWKKELVQYMENNEIMPNNSSQGRHIPEVQNDDGMQSSDYLLFAEYFMAQAYLAAKCSRDPSLQVGACVVDPDKRIVGVGYHSFPNNCSSEHFPEGEDPSSYTNSKSAYVCHAEMNAIVNRTVLSLKDCTIYITAFPCHECVKNIIQSGIKEVYYTLSRHSETPDEEISRRMLDAADVKYWRLKLLRKQVVLNLDDFDEDVQFMTEYAEATEEDCASNAEVETVEYIEEDGDTQNDEVETVEYVEEDRHTQNADIVIVEAMEVQREASSAEGEEVEEST